MHFFLAIDWTVNPVLAQIGPFEIRWYSLLFATGFIIGYQIVKSMFKREGQPLEHLDPLLTYLVLGTIIGARLGHCIFYDWDYYQHHILEMLLPVQFQPEFRFVGYKGLASHGGAVMIPFLLWLFAKRVAKKPFLWVMDRVMIPIALTGFFIRTGNVMNHEIIGKPSDAPWAFIFNQVDTIARHPVQLYEALLYLLTFIILFWMYWKTEARKYTGRLFGWFLVLLWGARFITEPFKRSQGGLENSWNTALSTGQLLSIPLILLGVYLLFRSYTSVQKS